MDRYENDAAADEDDYLEPLPPSEDEYEYERKLTSNFKKKKEINKRKNSGMLDESPSKNEHYEVSP